MPNTLITCMPSYWPYCSPRLNEILQLREMPISKLLLISIIHFGKKKKALAPNFSGGPHIQLYLLLFFMLENLEIRKPSSLKATFLSFQMTQKCGKGWKSSSRERVTEAPIAELL